MNFNNYTTRAAEAVQGTMQLAGQLGHQALTPLHLFLVLVTQREGLIPSLLHQLEIDAESVAAGAKAELTKLAQVSGGAQPYATPELQKVFDQAESKAGKLRDEYISTEHLFLALIEQSEVKKVISIKRDDVLKALVALRGHQRVTDPDPESKYQTLEKYSRFRQIVDGEQLCPKGISMSHRVPPERNPAPDIEMQVETRELLEVYCARALVSCPRDIFTKSLYLLQD